MRALIVILLYFTMVTIPASAQELDLLSRIMLQLEQHTVVRSEFSQRKQMAELKRPLLTTGRVLLSRQHGVLWQIEQPYRVSYAISEGGIIEIQSDGSRREQAGRSMPGLPQVSRILRALLGADMNALRETFLIEAGGTPDKWTIELKPRTAQVAQFAKGLRISGGRYVETLQIEEADEDLTVIRFRNTQSDRLPNAHELQLLGRPPAGS